MVYARMIEMGAAEDAPKIVKRLERTGVSEDDQVEQSVDRAGLGGKQQAQSITRQVEDKDRGATQGFLAPGSSIATLMCGNR